ncbi:MAG: patatin-like phospholipase family protein [bacterium]|nr:patatin-like phospholipase family protein [bacterium]
MRVLVLDGGGQLGTFGWGALCELYKQGIKQDYFDYYVCTSAGAFNAAFFLDGELAQGTRIWLKHLPERFWRPFRNDMDALREILTTIEPLDSVKIKNSKQKILVSLSNIGTLNCDYLCLNDQEDIISTLLACCAMPILAKSREVNGQQYYDGGLIDQPPLQKAETFKNAEIWVISNHQQGYRLNAVVWKIISLFTFDQNLARLLSSMPERQNAAFSRLEQSRGIKIIAPAQKLPIGFRSTNKQKIQKTFELGIETAKKFLRERIHNTKRLIA